MMPPRRYRIVRCLPALFALTAATGLWMALQSPPSPVENAGRTPATGAAECFKEFIRHVEQQRGLVFPAGFNVLGTTAEEIQQRHLADIKAMLPSPAGAAQRQAWEAMGFRWEPDWPVAEALAGLAAVRTGTHFDAVTNTLRVEEADFPVPRPGSRPRLMMALSTALLTTHRQPAALLASGNEDAALAQHALLAAEAGLLTMQCELAAVPAPAESRPEVYATPRFLRELLAFPASAAGPLAARLTESGAGFAGFDAAWQRRPFCTAALLDASVPAAEMPALPSAAVSLRSGTLGAYGIRTLLKSQLTRDEALRGSTGWRGDRYAFDGTLLTWRSRWQETTDAAAFAEGLAKVLVQAKGLPPESVRLNGSTHQCTTDRWSFRIHQEDTSVTVWSAPHADALPGDHPDKLTAITTSKP